MRIRQMARRLALVVVAATSLVSGLALLGGASALAAGAAPEANTGEPADVRRVGATLRGAVNPEEAVTSYFFEYGPTEAYGTKSAVLNAGGGNVPVEVSLPISGLTGNATYHYRVVAENENGSSEGLDTTFVTPAVDGVRTGSATGISQSEATLVGSLEPNELDTHSYFEYGVEESYGATTPSIDAGSATEAISVQTPITGLIPNQTYHFRVVAENVFGASDGLDNTFITGALPPAIDQPPSTANPMRSSVVATGTVNPEHSETIYRFVYVEAGEYAPLAIDPYAEGGSGAAVSAGAGLGDRSVEQVLTGLRPNTTYHYALVARNSAGYTRGVDGTFTTGSLTPPLVATGEASSISQNEATIAGSLDTEGLTSSYGFEIGTSTDYGPPTGLGTIGAGGGQAPVSLSLSGLQPGTTYHYRLEATNIDGTTYGADRAFTTTVYPNTFAVPPAPLPFVQVPAIAFPSEALAVTIKSKPKALTKAQKLARALKACRKGKNSKRPACERRARRGRFAAASPPRRHDRRGAPMRPVRRV
jgi:hypothetical protein